MFQKLCVLCALALTSCAQMSIGTDQISGNGRFLQMTTGGATFFQLDTASLDACRAEGPKINKNPSVEIFCSTVSQEAFLPYSFTSINVLTNVGLIGRVKTLEGCELLAQVVRSEKTQGYRISDCK